MSSKIRVYATQNFERNLGSISDFLKTNDANQEFDRLIVQLFGTIVPNLERFPDIGVRFFDKRPLSLEGMNLVESIEKKLKNKGVLRKYMTGDYIILYVLIGNDLYLLSIKHHKQLGFQVE